MDKTRLHVGKIVNTHGVRGEVKAIYYTDSPDFFHKVKNVILEPGGIQLHIQSFRPAKGCIIIRFEGYHDINQVIPLKHKDIYVDRSEAGEPEEGRYYIVDMIGLAVRTVDGVDIGEIIDVFQTGSNDVYETRDGKGRRVLIPAIEEVVKTIDMDKKEMVIQPLEGMIEHEI